MRVKIDYTKNAQQNANAYYENAKKLVKKKEGAIRAIRDLEAKLKKLEAGEALKKTRFIVKRTDIKWYEKFHWFYTSSNMLCIAGKSAQQNELINGKYFLEGDLFFHADIFGAPLTLLKDGEIAKFEDKEEVAQFAASYSSAWKNNMSAVDVYALKREQISKSTQSGSVGTGGFVMKGEREWFKSTPLGLIMYLKDGMLQVITLATFARSSEIKKLRYVELQIGNEKKSDAAKRIAKHIGFDDYDQIIQQLPAGNFKVKLSKI